MLPDFAGRGGSIGPLLVLDGSLGMAFAPAELLLGPDSSGLEGAAGGGGWPVLGLLEPTGALSFSTPFTPAWKSSSLQTHAVLTAVNEPCMK